MLRNLLVVSIAAICLATASPADACWWRHCCCRGVVNQGYASGSGYGVAGYGMSGYGAAGYGNGWGYSGANASSAAYGINPMVQTALLDLLRRSLSNLPLPTGPGPTGPGGGGDMIGVEQRLDNIQQTLAVTNQKLDTIAQRLSKYQMPDKPEIEIPNPPVVSPPVINPVTPVPGPSGFGAAQPAPALDQERIIREVAAQVRESLRADLQTMVNAAVANQPLKAGGTFQSPIAQPAADTSELKPLAPSQGRAPQ